MREWTIALRNCRISESLPVQLRLHRIGAKLFFEKLRCEETYQGVAQHTTALTTNRCLAANPQPGDCLSHGECRSGVEFWEAQRIGVEQHRAAIGKPCASTHGDQADRRIRRWSKRCGKKGARRSRERHQRFRMFAIVRARTFLEHDDHAFCISSAFEFVPVALKKEWLSVE